MVISGGIIKMKIFLRGWIILCMLLNAVTPQGIEDKGLSACELESLVKQILNPNPDYQMHANALRDQLRYMIQNKNSDIPYQTIDDSSTDYFDEDKRSVSSLARAGNYPSYGKRYLGALAKSGMMLRSNAYDDIKRSVATLAKNGQLPTQEPDTIYDDNQSQQWEDKRNLGSLAKSGYIGKRNIGTLARDFQLPNNGKRNLAALARLGLAPKRNIASLARQNSLYMAEKKNIAALKNSPVHGQRQKRDIYGDLGDYEVPDDVIQNYSMDYDDLRNQLNQLYGGPYEEKRFLGSLAKNGWFRPSAEKRNIGSLARLGLIGGNGYGFRQQEQKRHIGALARPDITPNKSDYYNPQRPFVDDAITTIKTIPIQLAGNHQHQLDYLDGVHHQDLQHYTGEVYDPQHITEHQYNKNNNNNNNKNINDDNNNDNNYNDEFINYLYNLSENNSLNNNNNNKNKINNNSNNDNNNSDEIQCSQRLNLMLDALIKY
ncbi:probable basic-leucine zipper transcription factor F isoform X2 [Condylostylus longicornis]|uniref:probable basic-leucine zipper transcription factor F isoform X2 n=1 Tax=Condylostylus longicornis TaxID=2530218 RepID=UPI00244E3C2F|nr:probable basic-leucine zipper transcription factor F isoform X2 [Condylostylus longicornis]